MIWCWEQWQHGRRYNRWLKTQNYFYMFTNEAGGAKHGLADLFNVKKTKQLMLGKLMSKGY